MALSDDVIAGINGVLAPDWQERRGQVVPSTQDITLRDGAVRLEATYLYADMANSTGLAQGYKDWAAAKVIRTYLNAASRIIRARGGEIRSFDGDRVMGIFVGDSKNTSAVKAAHNISWAVSEVIQPALERKWSDFKWTMGHGVGIDTGEALLVRGGVHGDNDIVSVGAAPNIAAKLSEVRGGLSINISADVYNSTHQSSKVWTDGRAMWERMGTQTFGGKSVTYYGSSWWVRP